MEPTAQPNVTKRTQSVIESKNEIAVRTFEQIFGKEEMSDEMAAAIRALQRICQANDLEVTEPVQFAFERLALYLNKLSANCKKQ